MTMALDDLPSGLSAGGRSSCLNLEGKAAPVSFELAVERHRLVGGPSYFVRVGILSGTRAIWTSDDVKIDITASVADVGAITLKPAK